MGACEGLYPDRARFGQQIGFYLDQMMAKGEQGASNDPRTNIEF